jgi:hypothetical protein
MARVLLLSATAEDERTDFAPLREAEESARLDRFRIHSITADAASADLILFLEFHGTSWSFQHVRRHPFVRRFREKCFLYCSTPFVIPFLPGVYTGVERAWASSRTRPGPYLGRTRNEFTTYTPPDHELPYLFSFMGSVRNAAVRRNLAALRHPRSFFQDTAEDYDRIQHRKMDRQERLDYDRRYAELTKASKFVLCPRGLSASSIRVFETMRMGRVPVILADNWVPPIGPRWEEFSIQVREADFARVPVLLEQRENEAVEMGDRARAAWSEWFSQEVLFHRLVELCLDIKANRKIPESVARWSAFSHYLQPFHIRRLAGSSYRFLRGIMKITSRQSQTFAPR